MSTDISVQIDTFVQLFRAPDSGLIVLQHLKGSKVHTAKGKGETK